MLPPDFAAFSFDAASAPADDALAERAVAIAGQGRIAVLGAGRYGLVLALARRGAHPVVFDPSRVALGVARDAARVAGVESRVTLFAADPRDVEIPGGADGALIPSFSWRALLFRQAQTQAVQCLARALPPRGALCVEVDRLPQDRPEGVRAELRRGPGGQVWWWRRGADEEYLILGCDAPRTETIEVTLSAISPEETAVLLRSHGLTVDAEPDPSEPRVLVVGRP